MKSTNVNDKKVKVTEFEYYDEYLETNVEVVLVYDMKKFYTDIYLYWSRVKFLSYQKKKKEKKALVQRIRFNNNSI